MLSDNEIKKNLNIKAVIHHYPPSGQKQVLLVNHKEHGKAILKLVYEKNERISREIDIVTEGQFDNVPVVLKTGPFQVGKYEGVFILEEFIDGETLKSINKDHCLCIADAMELTEQMLTIISQMEKKHIVHRDIKPDNIIRSSNGRWYLIDFGIARAINLNSLTQTGVAVGPHTPGYGAPELFQYNKRGIDSRADLFSLGVVLFEALTGKHPFVKGDELYINEIWYNTVTVTPESIIIDGDKDMRFMGLIQTFMQKHITRRPRNAKTALKWFMSIKKEIEG